MEIRTILTIIYVLVGTSFAYFFRKLYNARIFFTTLKAQGLPMPPHGFAAGHLQSLAPIVKQFPRNAIKVYLFGELNRLFAKSGAMYLDLWPLAEPFLVITSPYLANQVTTTAIAFEKPDALRTWFHSLAGGISIFDAPADKWKALRALFSRGFSANHLFSLIPVMVEETEIYCGILREHARKGDMFHLDTTNLRFMLDVIGRTALNVRLGCQVGPNPLADALLNQISWKISNQEVNPLSWLNFIRPIVEWNNGRKMDSYIKTEVDKRFLAYKSQKTGGEKKKQVECIIDLALQDYMADPARAASNNLDAEFKTFATRNMRMLLFSGHDSMGSTASYCFYLLSKTPSALAAIRAEHDAVLGTDVSKAGAVISGNPHILSQLPYTHAVVKEALRLFPPAASIRQGSEDVDLVDEDGTRYPTANCMVYILHLTIQRLSSSFVKPDEFIPERWLVGPEDPLYPDVKGAWRPFEYGPRNCIAQLMVMLEIKMVLAMTIREFDVQPAYEEWDTLHPRKGLKEVNGERVYQIDEGAAHPADHFPCRVYLREGK